MNSLKLLEYFGARLHTSIKHRCVAHFCSIPLFNKKIRYTLRRNVEQQKKFIETENWWTFYDSVFV